MRVSERLDVSKVGKADDYSTQLDRFTQSVEKVVKQLTRALNGGLGFGNGVERDNFDGRWFIVTTPATPNTDFVVDHNLNRLPIGFLIFDKDRAADIYSVSKAIDTITLRCSVASANVKGFIL